MVLAIAPPTFGTNTREYTNKCHLRKVRTTVYTYVPQYTPLHYERAVAELAPPKTFPSSAPLNEGTTEVLTTRLRLSAFNEAKLPETKRS